MKKIGLFFVSILLLSACGPAPTPITPTVDINATTSAMAADIIKGTSEAQLSATPHPTNTLAPANTQPPTETSTSLPAETSTAEVTFTPPTVTIDPLMGMVTSTPWIGTLSPGNTDGLATGFLRIENNTGVKEIVVTLTGVTLKRQQPVYYAYKVTNSLVITILQAKYSYVVQVPNKNMFTGTFGQANKDKTVLRVTPTSVIIIGP